MGFILAVASYVVIYQVKESKNSNHITTAHAWAAVCVGLLCLWQMVLGIGGYYFPRIKAVRKTLPKNPLEVHHTQGNVTWILCLVTVALGLHSSPKLAEKFGFYNVWGLTLAMPVAFYLCKSFKLKKKPTPEMLERFKAKKALKFTPMLPFFGIFILGNSKTVVEFLGPNWNIYPRTLYALVLIGVFLFKKTQNDAANVIIKAKKREALKAEKNALHSQK